MSPSTSIVISLIMSAAAGITAVGTLMLVFRRPRALAEEMFQLLQEYARKSDLDHLRSDIQHSCHDRHAAIDKSLTELFRLDRARTKEIIDKLDGITASLSLWQQGIERQQGNQDGRIANLERKQK